jgi:hypothetical protein
MLEKWQIPLDAKDWQAGWDDAERFHMRQFKSRTFRDKVKAMEDMAEVVQRFQARNQRPDDKDDRGAR